MNDMNDTPHLRSGHRRASQPETGARAGQNEAAPSPPNAAVHRLFDPEIAKVLETIPPWTIKRAWFALAHLVLEPGSVVADIGCRDGAMAYVMAVLSPTMKFVGVDKNADTIKSAQDRFKRNNLEFRTGDLMDNALPEDSVDAIICNNILHEIFSSSDFNVRLVRGALRECQRYLKPGGTLMVRDFAEPANADDLVLMEMPDTPSRSTKIEELSDPDLLVWYSEYATMQDDPASSGFFLEEMPPRFPRTRLFRLPHKWAYEFIMRKDARAKWSSEVPKEYTFFNEREYHKTFNELGLRVLYSAPHWDDAYIKKHFDGRFRLMDEELNPLGNPATSFIILAKKVDVRDSLLISERRKAKSQETQFHITTYRNEVDGRLVEVVSRNVNLTDIIPFTIMDGGRLVVYLHEGIPRAIVNSIPRGGRNLDGKFWSGHLTEAVSVDTEIITEVEEKGQDGVIDFMDKAMGLRVSIGQSFTQGPEYLPNPRFISETVGTRYVSVEPSIGRYVPQFVRDDIKGFSTTGAIRAFDAQSVLNAISVGVLPSGHLEMQLLVLFDMLGIEVTDWADSPLTLKQDEPGTKLPKVSDILKKTEKKQKVYKEVKGAIGKIRVEKSIFVDEGHDGEGANKGLAARDIDFAINEEYGMNVAVVMPLSKNMDGEVMAGVIMDYMPIPERYSGDGSIVTLPMFNLPKEIQTMDMAKRYVAEQFQIKPDQVSKLGEPYFSHIGVTPQRIFPFAVNAPITNMAAPKHGVTSVAPIVTIGQLHWRGIFDRYDCNLLKLTGRVNRRIFSQNEMGIACKWAKPLVPQYADIPFTTGTVVDTRTPMQQRKSDLSPVATFPMKAANLSAQNMLDVYGSTPTGGFSRAGHSGRAGDKTSSSGGGGKKGGGSGGGTKKEPKKKDPSANLPKPEPT